ncbi:MAG: hypothetical protein U0790_00815 [Isosphaeraceae bacterium]
MRPRPVRRVRPVVEGFEPRLAPGSVSDPLSIVSKKPPRPPSIQPYTLVRITNPTPFNARLDPPFQQVRVQSRQPIKGQTYNLGFVSVRNSTFRTFTADDGLAVRVSGQNKPKGFPILTGDQTWKPGQVMVFYILSKEYYPFRPVTSAGFQFNLKGSPGTAIPGPSGIFQRIVYKDDKSLAKTINWIVPYGPGAKGHELGLPDTAIWEFVQTGRPSYPIR